MQRYFWSDQSVVHKCGRRDEKDNTENNTKKENYHTKGLPEWELFYGTTVGCVRRKKRNDPYEVSVIIPILWIGKPVVYLRR